MSVPQKTEQALRNHLDSKQVSREQMCLSLLQLDKRFSLVEPRRPKGGRDGGRDIQATYQGEHVAYGAVGFVNSANDGCPQKRVIKTKFVDDLKSALRAKPDLRVFVFFTNIDLTPKEQDEYKHHAHSRGISTVEIFYRERIRIMLDNPRGLAIRFAYLDIELSRAEQAAFFNEFGAELQALVTRKFDTVDRVLHRLEFLQDLSRELIWLSAVVRLDKMYSASELGHFRIVLRFKPLRRRRSQSGWWIALRDSHVKMWGEEKVSMMGFRSLAGVTDNEPPLSDRPLHYQMTDTDVLRIEPEVTDDFPIRTVGELDQTELQLYCNESLVDKIAEVEVFANTYRVASVDRRELGEIFGWPSYYWPLPLTETELASRWIALNMKSDQQSSIYKKWLIDFHLQTPVRTL
jgi:hypothetical protein